MQGMAAAVAATGRKDESIKIEEGVLAGRRKALGADHPDTLMAMDNLADSLAASGRREEALKLDREALALCLKKNGPDDSITLKIMSNLADFLADLGRPREAMEFREKVLTVLKAGIRPDRPDTLEAMTAMAGTLILLKDTGRAEALLNEVLTKTEKSGASKDLEARLKATAELRFRQKQFAAGETLCLKRIESRRSRTGWEQSFTLFDANIDLGRLLSEWAWEERNTDTRAAQEHAFRGAALLREALAADLRDKTTAAQRRPDVLSRLGGALCATALTDPSLSAAQRREALAEAEKCLLEGQTGMEKEKATKPPVLRDGLERLVRLYEGWVQPKLAAAWRARLEKFDNDFAEPRTLTSSP
jgi:tetratricopeptide (TPR) repeat protein